ncbi:MAG: PQQ-dependent sugar dehydrogenase [Bacteroidota bacterium]
MMRLKIEEALFNKAIIIMAQLVFCCAIFSCKEKREKSEWIVSSEEGKLILEVVTDSISIPFGMAFLPNGQLLVSDRPKGEIILVDINSGKKILIKGVPPVVTSGDGGIMDVLPHPDFEQNNLIFYAYSVQDEKGASLAVESALLKNDSLLDRKRIFTAQPYYKTYNFYGSRLLLKGGFLFITTGVTKTYQDSAQLLTNHLGKVMRVNEDGSIPEDNPFVNVPGALPEIWCLGTRNPQGLTIHPHTQEIWENEHGPKGGDEVNILQSGKNYGWPLVTYGLEYDSTPVGKGLTHMEGMEQPVHYYVPSIAPSGMEFYTGSEFPMWKDNLFNGSMVLRHLNRLVLKDNKVVHEERLLLDQKWRVRCVKQGPDGFLYIGVDGGMILRIRPA